MKNEKAVDVKLAQEQKVEQTLQGPIMKVETKIILTTETGRVLVAELSKGIFKEIWPGG